MAMLRALLMLLKSMKGKAMQNTLEKIDKHFCDLIEIDDSMIDILEESGKDTETEYTKEYLSLLDQIQAFRENFHELLFEKYLDLIRDVEHDKDYPIGKVHDYENEI